MRLLIWKRAQNAVLVLRDSLNSSAYDCYMELLRAYLMKGYGRWIWVMGVYYT